MAQVRELIWQISKSVVGDVLCYGGLMQVRVMLAPENQRMAPPTWPCTWPPTYFVTYLPSEWARSTRTWTVSWRSPAICDWRSSLVNSSSHWTWRRHARADPPRNAFRGFCVGCTRSSLCVIQLELDFARHLIREPELELGLDSLLIHCVSNKYIAVRKVATPIWELTCHMGSHSVICHPAEVTFPPLTQPKLVLD